MIVKEIVLVCLELLMLFLSIILAHWKNPNHEDCPPRKNSWCFYNRDVVSGTNYHQPIKNLLPPAVVAEIQPLFDRLSSKEFLASCEDSKTQKVNKS